MRASLFVVALMAIPALGGEQQSGVIDCIFPPVGPPCNESEPATRWEYPSCADYRLDDSLIEGAEKGDRSAIELLERRYASTVSWQERARIGAALLGRARDDGPIWKEIETHAANLLRFREPGEETEAKYKAFCAENGYEEEEYLEAAWYFFDAAAMDRRARPLLVRSLAIDDSNLMTMAVYGLAMQHDEAALPLIEKALEKAGNLSAPAAALAFYRSEAADQVAMRFITDEEEREQYREQRRQQP
ncbi:MAG TPA: hypothetical protein VJ276_18570 [Thermoanaerobaculia bacterium]|nr:hypothetical protein [Thermoanaerobaculia bacterium]